MQGFMISNDVTVQVQTMMSKRCRRSLLLQTQDL